MKGSYSLPPICTPSISAAVPTLRTRQKMGRSIPQRDTFQHLLHLADSILSRGSGKWAAGPPSSCQLLKCWPHNVSCEIPKLGSQKVLPSCSSAPRYGTSISLSPTDPSMCLHSDLGLPEVEEDRAKEKSLRCKQIQCIFGEVGGIVSICAK